MEKIAIITDTTADLDDDIIKKYNIYVLSFRIIYKDREYIDRVNITPREVYKNLKYEVPTSSMPSIGDMEKLFVTLEEKGYTHAIAVTISSGLSGIFNGITMVSKNHPKIKTYVCDSKSISIAEGIIPVECAKLAIKGKSFQEIVDTIPSIMKRIHLFFVLGTLEYLKKGGRIGRVSGSIAEFLDIKPIISVDSEGKYYTFSKARGRKQSLKKLLEAVKGVLSNKKCKVYIRDGDGLEDAERMYEIIKDLPNVESAEFGGDISPVSGVHTGSQLVGIVCFEVE